MVEVAVIRPGAVSANTNIDLPVYYKKIASLIAAFKTTKVDVSHAACAASGAVYSSDTVLASPLNVLTALSVVTTTPGAGQIQLVDEDTIQLGDAVKDGEEIILVYLPKGEVPGF